MWGLFYATIFYGTTTVSIIHQFSHKVSVDVKIGQLKAIKGASYYLDVPYTFSCSIFIHSLLFFPNHLQPQNQSVRRLRFIWDTNVPPLGSTYWPIPWKGLKYLSRVESYLWDDHDHEILWAHRNFVPGPTDVQIGWALKLCVKCSEPCWGTTTHVCVFILNVKMNTIFTMYGIDFHGP